MPEWNLLLLLLLLLMMMMTTVIISVELEGVIHRQTESALDCVLEKKLPSSSSNSNSTLGLLFLVVVVVSESTAEEISLC